MTQPLCFEGAVYAYQNETPIAWGSDNALYWGVSGRSPTESGDVSVRVSRSGDLGDTWASTLVAEGLAEGEYEFISRPITGLAVDADSADDDIVYVGWQTFPTDEPRAPQVAVSTDDGASFSGGRTPFDEQISDELGGESGLQGLPPKLAVDDDGVLYVLFPGQAGGDEGPDEVPNRLLLARSNGRLDVAWWDWRDGAALYGNDVYYTHSVNDGDTWSNNVRVTDQSIDRRIGYWGNNADMRSRPGIASTDHAARIAWSDTRLAVAGANTQDIYTATVQHGEVPTGESDSVLWYVIAILAGLTAGGLVLAILGLVARRRSTHTGRQGLSPAS